MRITENMRAIHALSSAQGAASRLDRASRVASTGLRVEAPSDDPAAYSRMVSADARLARIAARSSGLDRVSSDLETAEGTLASAGDLVVRARELALQMSNGSLSASDRKAAAEEVRSLRNTLIGLANTRGATGYLFGGTRTDQPPVDASGNYQGNAGNLHVEVADGVVADASASGANAFSIAGGRDPFAELAALATALDANDVATVQTSLTNLDAVFEQLVDARADAGTKIDRFRSASQYADDAKLAVAKERADAVEADAPTAYSELTVAQAAYERSLTVTQKLLAISTMNRGG